MSAEPNVEDQARSQGWVPKEDWTGPEGAWVDAQEYVDRGKQIMPILRANNKRLEEQLAVQRTENEQMRRMLQANQKAIEALQETSTEAAKTADAQTRETLIATIKAAREAGDVDAEENAREELRQVNDRLRAKPAPQAPPPPDTSQFDTHPDWLEFRKANEWWDKDPVMQAASVQIARQMAQAGELKGTPSENFAKIAAATRQRFGMNDNERRSAPSRVAESRGGAAEEEGQRGASFGDLPADAKEACQKLAPRLVGPGKKFPDMKAWQKAYATDYFRS